MSVSLLLLAVVILLLIILPGSVLSQKGKRLSKKRERKLKGIGDASNTDPIFSGEINVDELAISSHFADVLRPTSDFEGTEELEQALNYIPMDSRCVAGECCRYPDYLSLSQAGVKNPKLAMLLHNFFERQRGLTVLIKEWVAFQANNTSASDPRFANITDTLTKADFLIYQSILGGLGNKIMGFISTAVMAMLTDRYLLTAGIELDLYTCSLAIDYSVELLLRPIKKKVRGYERITEDEDLFPHWLQKDGKPFIFVRQQDGAVKLAHVYGCANPLTVLPPGGQTIVFRPFGWLVELLFYNPHTAWYIDDVFAHQPTGTMEYSTVLLRLLLQPTDDVYTHLRNYLDTHHLQPLWGPLLAHSNNRTGTARRPFAALQFRQAITMRPGTPFNISAADLCLFNNKNSSTSDKPTPVYVAILTLLAKYRAEMAEKYKDLLLPPFMGPPTERHIVVPSTNVTGMKQAVGDVILLSQATTLITTKMSTFGQIAYVMRARPHGFLPTNKDSNYAADPCFHRANWQPCFDSSNMVQCKQYHSNTTDWNIPPANKLC